MIDCCERSAFSWSWLPSMDWHFYDGYIETFSFLHSLYVSLETSRQLFDQFISRDIISRLSDEKFWTIIILVRTWTNQLDVILNSALVESSGIHFLNCISEITLWVWARLKLRNCAFVVNFWHRSCRVHLLWRKPQTLGCVLGFWLIVLVAWNTWMEFITSIHCAGVLFLQPWSITVWINHIDAAWSLGHNLHFGISWRSNVGLFHFCIVMGKICCSLSWFVCLFWHWRLSGIFHI